MYAVSFSPDITIVDEITEIIDKRWPTVWFITVQNQVHTHSLLSS